MLGKMGFIRGTHDRSKDPVRIRRQLGVLPTSFDQRPNWPLPYDQSNLGSCTGNGVGGILHYKLINSGKIKSDINSPAHTPSRLFIYRHERVIEGTTYTDSGAEVKDGLITLADKGACFEDLWPYDISKFTVNPSAAAWTAAWLNKIKIYETIPQTLVDLQTAIYENKPVVFGFNVYTSFDGIGSNGIMPMPGRRERIEGGHCVVATGYDLNKGYVICRNSWGINWGDKGWFYMPIPFFLSRNCSDFWVID